MDVFNVTIPKQYEIGLPILQLLRDKRYHHIDKIRKHLEKYFELTDEEIFHQKSSGGEGLFHNRIRWANFYLKKAGLVESPFKTGKTKITDLGLELLDEEPEILNRAFLMRYPGFVNYQNSLKRKKI